MSTDPTGAESEEYCMQVLSTKYIRLELNREDWCRYNGECKISNVNILDNTTLCLFCKYRKELDMPQLIDDASKE